MTGTEPRRPLGDERGSTIVIVALAMTALLSAVALAIDVGMLLNARSEAQRTADSAALAGAGALILAPGNEAVARATAIEYGTLNTIHGENAVVLPEDVEVDLEEEVVRVTVRRSAQRGNAIETWFARVFGVNEVDVSAVAAAAVAMGHGADCVKPWGAIDGFKNNDEDPAFNEGVDEYVANPDADPPVTYGYGTATGSAYRNALQGTAYFHDVGRRILLKPGDPRDAIHPGWFYPWAIPQPDGSPPFGAANYRENISTCNPSPIYVGEEYMVEPGNMIGPTQQGVRKLIEMDPLAYWDETTNTPVSFHPDRPREARVPVFLPTYDLDQGRKPLQFTNIMGLFIEEMVGNDVYGRIMYISGLPATAEDGAPGPLIRYVRLVE